jgi:hypothetical protein
MKTEMAGRCSKASSGDEDEEWRLKAVNRAEWVSVIKETKAIRGP